MVSTTEWNGELVTYLATQRARLRKSEMMRIRWGAGADEAWLLSDVAQMLAVTIVPRRCKGEYTFIDAARAISSRRRSLRLLLPLRLYRTSILTRRNLVCGS